jgi:hypothetical protein
MVNAPNSYMTAQHSTVSRPIVDQLKHQVVAVAPEASASAPSGTITSVAVDAMKEDDRDGYLSKSGVPSTQLDLKVRPSPMSIDGASTQIPDGVEVNQEGNDYTLGGTDLPSDKLTPTEQLDIIDKETKSPLVVGDQMFLIASVWYAQWKKWCLSMKNQDSDDIMMGATTNMSRFPGSVDNAVLFDDMNAGTLKPNLLESSDYFLVTEVGWKNLVSW